MTSKKAETKYKNRINGNGQMPPNDKDTELAVIGGMLISASYIEIALNHPIGRDDFYSRKWAKVYDVIVETKYNDGLDVNPVVIKNKLSTSSEFMGLDDWEIKNVLVEAMDYAAEYYPLSTGFKTACRILEDQRLRREILVEVHKKTDEVYNSEKLIEPTNSKFRRENLIDISRWYDEDPPVQKDVFKGVIPQGIVGQLAGSSGLLKTQLKTYLMVSAASGLPVFDFFFPERPMTVLGLLAEDPVDKTHERFKRVINHFEGLQKELLIKNLHLFCEESGELLELDSRGNVQTTGTFKILSGRIRELKPDFIVIDPMSMWFGIDENSNSHACQWIKALKEMAGEATIIFNHHTSKAGRHELDLYSARGGSALSDGSRWIANVKRCDEVIGKKYNLQNPEKYIQYKITKNSYALLTHEEIFFTFNEKGGLERAYLQQENNMDIADSIGHVLRINPGKLLSINEICKLPSGQFVRDYVKEIHGKLPRNDIADAIRIGIKNGVLKETEVSSEGRPKMAIRP